jgi:hypothetical protein
MTADKLKELLMTAKNAEGAEVFTTAINNISYELVAADIDYIVASLRLVERIKAGDVELRDATGLSVRQCAALAKEVK